MLELNTNTPKNKRKIDTSNNKEIYKKINKENNNLTKHGLGQIMLLGGSTWMSRNHHPFSQSSLPIRNN